MGIENLKPLMQTVGEIANRFKLVNKISAESFNVFNLLKLDTSEVRLHTAILTDLLNPQGTHGQDDLFLKLFLKQMNITNFDSNNSEAKSNYYTGPINQDYSEGGSLDILITNRAHEKIIIENKINAVDQKNQLLRYYNYDKNACLIYLSLNGESPTIDSTGGKLDNTQFKVISYSFDIITWLEECKKEAAIIPVIRETIVQYIFLLKQLTNQTNHVNMKQDIKSILVQNLNYVDLINLCSEVLNETVNETKNKFVKLFNNMFPPTDIHTFNDSTSIKVQWGEDSDGVYFSYSLYRQQENISSSDDGNNYREKFREINGQFFYTGRNIMWFNPKPFDRGVKFEKLDKKLIMNMDSDNNQLINFIQGLMDEELKIRNAFFERLKN